MVISWPSLTEGAAVRPRGAPLFRLENVAVAIGGRRILDGLSLVLPAEKVVGLVGPNGSGKSTLLRVLANQLGVQTGTAKLLGRDLPSYNGREFARLVAYMPQFTPPAEGMTVRELVSLSRFPWHGTLGRFGAGDAAKVEEALSAAGLESFAHRLVDTLSGGERQRAWLALMLAQDTRCMLLDEPTSALDIAHQVEMLDLVRRSSAERRLGAVVVLHDINMAARICDEIIALRDGRIFARGLPDAIMDADVLGGIYDIPMRIFRASPGGNPVAHVA